jgi:Bacterial Ig-like domain (group 3)
MRSWGKRVLAGGSVGVLMGVAFAGVVGTASPAGADPTTFSITANGSSSAAIGLGTSATLAEAGLPDAATGTVTFSTPSIADLCDVTLPDLNCTTPVTLTPGNYQISASYSGDGTYDPSNSTNTVIVTVLAPTTTVASATPSNAPSGSPITFSATVTSSYSIPTGTVNFRTPARTLCTATITSEVASCSAATAPIGVNTVTALYLGDGTSDKSHGSTTVTVFRASPSLSCARLAGKATSMIKVAICTPFSAANRSARAPGSILSSGGTLTWSRSGQTTVVSLTSSSPGQGACPRKSVEYDLSGDVTGGTSLYTLAFDPVSMRVCESIRSHSVKLVPGTQAEF